MRGDAKVDSNCNGIFGLNKSSGIPFEEELCGGSGQRGIIYIGDSVGAHFRAPPQWFTPSLLSSQILQNLSYVISNEFDWPHLGRGRKVPATIHIHVLPDPGTWFQSLDSKFKHLCIFLIFG